jgi:molecular chaperone Hsp33
VGETPAELRCDCSHERVERVLISLGAEELQDMIEQDGKAELRCHFCRTAYNFTSEELMALREAATAVSRGEE